MLPLEKTFASGAPSGSLPRVNRGLSDIAFRHLAALARQLSRACNAAKLATGFMRMQQEKLNIFRRLDFM